MPRAKRTPISYQETEASIFRPRDVVEAEIAALDSADDDVENERTNERTDERTSAQSNERTKPAAAVGESMVRASTPDTDERPVAQSNERAFERTNERNRVRHSFDIWHDQLLDLAMIQTRLYGKTGKKPKMGELVQEALDAYIAQKMRETNE
jgi:hypothetical protein